MSTATAKWVKLTLTVSLLFGLCIIPSLPMVFADRQRMKQRECRTGLQAVMARFHELQDGGVPPSFPELRAAVPGMRHYPYTFVLGEGVTVPPLKDLPEEPERLRQLELVRTLVQPGLRGSCPDCQLTIACVGNMDGDAELDLLSLSSAPRYGSGTYPIDPGEVFIQSKDFANDPAQALRFERADGGR